MQAFKNRLLQGRHGRPLLLDLFLPQRPNAPLVIYAHGFNGFKDWGNFDRMAERFAEAGFGFLKFNFSHNGTTPDAPETFTDPEAFGQNNYTKELDDLQTVMDWALSADNAHQDFIDRENLFLLGHSRGGGIVLLTAAEDRRLKAVATWASVADCKTPWGAWPPERLQRWKESGVEHYTNSRTGQQLPLYYQLHEDYQTNKERLDVLSAVSRLSVPLLICHGTKDEAVPVEKAQQLYAAAKNAELFLVESDHVFGRRHPWPQPQLPEAMDAVLEKTIGFFKRVSH